MDQSPATTASSATSVSFAKAKQVTAVTMLDWANGSVFADLLNSVQFNQAKSAEIKDDHPAERNNRQTDKRIDDDRSFDERPRSTDSAPAKPEAKVELRGHERVCSGKHKRHEDATVVQTVDATADAAQTDDSTDCDLAAADDPTPTIKPDTTLLAADETPADDRKDSSDAGPQPQAVLIAKTEARSDQTNDTFTVHDIAAAQKLAQLLSKTSGDMRDHIQDMLQKQPELAHQLRDVVKGIKEAMAANQDSVPSEAYKDLAKQLDMIASKLDAVKTPTVQAATADLASQAEDEQKQKTGVTAGLPATAATDGRSSAASHAARTEEFMQRVADALDHRGFSLTPAVAQTVAAPPIKAEGMPALKSAGATPAVAAVTAPTDGQARVHHYEKNGELSFTRTTRGGTAGLPPAVEQVSVLLHKAMKAGENKISIMLRPHDLGRVDVKLEITDGLAHGVVIASDPKTLELLQKDSRNLERALQEAGLRTDPNGLQFQLRGDDKREQQQAAQHDQRRANQQAAFALDDALPAAAADEAAEEEIVYLRPGRVNLKV